MTTIHRSPTSPMLGGTLFVLAVWLTSWLASGCVEIDCDDATLPPVVINPPPPQPEQPQPPIEPELWCGLESDVEQTVDPILGESWGDGQPFEVAGGVAALEFTEWSGFTGIVMHFFDQNNVRVDRWITAFTLGGVFSSCWFYVHDVLVDGPRVYVAFVSTCRGPDQTIVHHANQLVMVDLHNGASGAYSLWPLNDEIYKTYQLAVDGDGLALGSYHVFSAQLGVRKLRWSNTFLEVGDELVVRGTDANWQRDTFVGFDAKDGLLTYRISDPVEREVQTTRYRTCD